MMLLHLPKRHHPCTNIALPRGAFPWKSWLNHFYFAKQHQSLGREIHFAQVFLVCSLPVILQLADSLLYSFPAGLGFSVLCLSPIPSVHLFPSFQCLVHISYLLSSSILFTLSLWLVSVFYPFTIGGILGESKDKHLYSIVVNWSLNVPQFIQLIPCK